MPNQNHQKKDDFRPLHSIAVASGAGLTLVVSIGIGIWLGQKCDSFFGTGPWGTVFFSIMGAASGLWSVIKQIMNDK